MVFCAALAAQSPPVGRLATIDGRSSTGALTVAADGKVQLVGAAGETVLALDEILSFEPEAVVLAPVDAPHRVWLRSGVELPAVRLAGLPVGDGAPSRLLVELPAGATVELPIGSLAAVRHGGPERPQQPSFDGDRVDPPANNDLLYVVKDGKASRSSVTVTGLLDGKIDFDLRGRAFDFDLAGVTGIVFGKNTGFAADRFQKPRASLELTTGERLDGRLLGFGSEVRLQLDEGAVVRVPGARVFRLGIASDRLRWLSELTPSVEQTPAFDRTWPWTVDRSIAGPGFQIGGKAFSRGIGLVPRTRLTYDLGGNYDVFEAFVGIDDRGGPQAHAVFRVLVDDKVAYESTGRTRGQPPELVRVELGKCRRLAIEVDFGKNYDLGDYCAFADARVVRR
jgi:hypothetical protein